MNKTYCPAAFREIYVDGSGQYKLCCYQGKNPDLAKYKDDKTLPFEYFMSKELENIRNAMYEGKPVKGCELCYQQEERVGKSYRTERYLKKYHFADTVGDVQLKLRINGSYCNLGCYMCFPNNSSTRRTELTAVYGKEYTQIVSFEKPYVAVKHEQWNRMIENIIENIHLVSYIKMTGGEPLQLPKHWEFLDRIPNKHAKNISLSYDTNFTEVRYKNHSVYDIVDKFKHVHFGISCDHFGKKLQWMRYPIDVEKFEKNLKDCKDIIGQLNCTVSILNLHDLIEIKNYYKTKFDMPVVFDNIARAPKFLSVCNFDDVIKDKFIKLYSDYPFVVDELKKQSWGLLEQGKEYCQRLSDHRGFQYKELWPNL